jgi:hypothetical protein
MWGESSNPCIIYALLVGPLDTLTITYGGTSAAQPSLMHTRIRLHSSETCMTVATAKLPGLIITSLISPYPTLTAIAFWYLNHDWSPPVLPLQATLHLCSCMSSNPSGLTNMFQLWGGVWNSHQSQTPFSGTTLHAWWVIWCIHQNDGYGSVQQNNDIFSYWEGLTILETP